MPMYEYTCANPLCVQCDKVVTVVKSMFEARRPETCECGRRMERIISPSRINVKGGTPIHHRRKP